MRAFITSTGIISPQPTHHASQFPADIASSVSNRLVCIEPDYKTLISPLLLRRMPRILKMGLAGAQLCINRAGNINPDGIIIGTGLGCLDNLEKFLKEVIDNREHISSVLPFINSTHNAVAAQISMLLKNQNYNVTYCHRGFSFESALLDALMLIHEKQSRNILVGGIDECTSDFMLLHSYLNRWKEPVNNLDLLSVPSPGTIAGEGSSFFLLSGSPQSENTGVSIEGIHTFLTHETADIQYIENEIDEFLKSLGVSNSDVDCVILGINGDPVHDAMYQSLINRYFSSQAALYYKHLCGEYYTSSAFALWLGAVILRDQHIPEIVTLKKGLHHNLNNLLIYNTINLTEHSLIFLNYGSF